jgi:peptidoglycan-N-acetylglucosamine deacetylase
VAAPIELPTWPDDSDVAVCFTFDVDADVAWLSRPSDQGRRLSTISEGRFGVIRGLPRVLALLRDYGISGTFYVPGMIAEHYPAQVSAVAHAGHEIGHHGHGHLHSYTLTAAEQREEIERGLSALEKVANRIQGYRSPAWELTPETFALLIEHGFAYDSSCMGDDRPYYEQVNGERLLELPVHWSMDDYPYFGWDVAGGGNLAGPGTWLESSLAEFESALRDRRLITYTLHPEVIGRGYRLQALERLIDEMRRRSRPWFATHAEVAALLP